MKKSENSFTIGNWQLAKIKKSLANSVLQIACCLLPIFSFAQNNVGMGTINPDPSAVLDLQATDKGFLVPRLPDTAGITAPVSGLLIYRIPDNTFYYFKGTYWKAIIAGVEINGSIGSIGSTGLTGSTGSTGSTGLTGSTGTTGSTGSTGSTGLTGSTGSIGSIGATGTTGTTGSTGSTGLISNGTAIGNTTYWDGGVWVLNNNNIYNAGASVGIGTAATPAVSAKLELSSTTQGTLITRMTTVQRDAIVSPVESLLIFNTTTKCFEAWNQGTAAWVAIGCVNCTSPGPFSTSAATNMIGSSFDANWTISSLATAYFLDVATDIGFFSIVAGYSNLNVGNVLSYGVSGLTCGTYYYRIRATNACGSTANLVTNTVTTIPPSQPSIITGNTALCKGDNAVAYSVSNVVGVTYTWTYSGLGYTQALGGTTNSITANFSAAATSGTLTVIPSNACGIGTAQTLAINLSDSPTTANAGADITGCDTSTATLSGNIASVGTGSWSVVSGAATITAANSPTSGITGLSIPGTATLRWTISNSPCVASSDEVVISIIASPTAAAASTTPTLCISTVLTNITHATTGATGIGAATGLPAGVTAAWASNVITISGTPTASGTFNYTIPLTGGCGTVNATGTITVTPANTAAAASSTPTLCISTVLTNITHATTGATGIGAATGLPAGVTATWASNTITISGTPSASGTYNYTIPLTGGCGAVNATGTITVTPANTAAAASTTPTLCISTVLTNITHATTGATGIGSATGLPAGVTAAWASNTITISGTPTASGTFSYSIPLIGGCGSVNATGTITVTPANTAAAASSTPTLCISTVLTNITHATTGATGIGAATGLPAGVTAAWASNVITIIGTPTASGTFNYTIPLTGGCGTVNATGTITVTPANTAAAASATPTLCISTVLTNITHATTGATGIGAATGLPAGVTATWASNTITISGTPTASGTFTYSIPLTGGCGSVNATGTITVIATPTNAAAGADQLICATTATLAGNTATVGAGSWTLVSGAGTITTSSSPTSGITGLGVGANVFRWTISNAPCTATSDDITITRSDNPTAANAGADINPACDVTTATLSANTPTVGTGAWSVISGTATVTSTSSPSSGVTGLAVPGTATLRWTISNAPCTASTDEVIITTIACCPSTIAITHLIGSVAPESKSVTYGVVTSSLSGASKCWITQNLGATIQAISVTDNTDAAAGWYWQFNRKQGYKALGITTGSTPTPTFSTASISENSDWLAANDPCTIELGAGWRIPTYTEWFNADGNGAWANRSDAYNSVLKIHAAGNIDNITGNLNNRAILGLYFSSTTKNSTTGGHSYCNGLPTSQMDTFTNKNYGFSLRCLRD